MSLSLSGKRIVVTGATGVLGRAVAETAAQAGARVFLIGRGAGAGADGAPPGVEAIETGVDLTRDAEAIFSKVKERFGGIEGLFNIAGAFEWSKVEDADVDLWRMLYEANVVSAAAASRAALPLAGAGAVIVNVGAGAAHKAPAGMGPYAAAKAGVLRLTESLAEELKPRGVRVYSISPLIIDTPRNRADMPKADFSTWTRPDDLARRMLALIGEGPPSGADIRVG